MANQEPKQGEIYRHFKGGTYEIILIALDCENASQKKVVYKSLYKSEKYPKGTIWSRSLIDFCGEKIQENGSKIKRFTLIK